MTVEVYGRIMFARKEQKMVSLYADVLQVDLLVV